MRQEAPSDYKSASITTSHDKGRPEPCRPMRRALVYGIEALHAQRVPVVALGQQRKRDTLPSTTTVCPLVCYDLPNSCTHTTPHPKRPGALCWAFAFLKRICRS